MSKRAEGCGQWLSAKTQKTTTQLAQLRGGKTKKKKGLLNFASRGQSGGLNIHISCSPLSPRTRKKLKNAKQSKLDMFFKEEPRPNVSANDNRVVPVKRQREDSSSGYSTEGVQSNEQLICSQEKEISDNTDFNISGISHLSDSFDNSDEFIENNLHQEAELENNRDSLSIPILNPPNKKARTSRSGGPTSTILTGSERTERNKLLTEENEPSQSFHFSQWRRDQIATCKKIQDENSNEGSPCADASSLISVDEESDLTLDQGSVGVEFSETPPFQFTQWANQQVEVCRRIQKETDMVLHQSRNSGEQSIKLKLGSRERNSAQKLTDHTDPQFDFSESAKNQVQLCQNFTETEDTGSANWESGKWGEWVYKTGKTASTPPLSCESEFQFSEWVKGQVQQCRVIQEDSEERLK